MFSSQHKNMMRLLLLSILCLSQVPVGRSFQLTNSLTNSKRGRIIKSMMLLGPIRQCTAWTKPTRGCSRGMMRWMSDSASNEAFIEKQREKSNSLLSSSDPESFENEADHLKHQKQVFDAMADTFSSGETISDNLFPVYQYLAKTIIGPSESSMKILDVACGSGALWPFLLEESSSAMEEGNRLDVTGIDLSESMVSAANQLAKTLGDGQERATFRAIESEILAYCKEAENGFYDVVVINACFGNFWKPFDVLSSLSKIANETIFVSHPLGADFVARLHEQDPRTVPHRLPTSIQTWQQQIALQQLPLRMKNLTLSFNREPFYLAELTKTRASALESVMRLSGNVDRGYGRGGKKLGFPTANLPSQMFQGALEPVQTGVYFGWAMVQNRVFKAVVNVGYSPTFEGLENPEKIVEAHLILRNEELTDFYDERMRLLLVGFLRPEMKFPSFSDLVSQINKDVFDANDILDDAIYNDFKTDAIFEDDNWKGSSGSSADASWEFQPMVDLI